MELVQPTGPVPARIMLVGEAPGETEVKEGRPFAGMSGRILDGLLRDAGIVREQCYITNVIKWRPHGNDFGTLYTDSARTKPTLDLSNGVDDLTRECLSISPHIIVALGGEALRALTGRRSISDWRGSVIPGPNGIKTIGTFHPAAIAREWKFRPAALADFQRVLRESTFPEIRVRPRTYAIIGEPFNAGRIESSSSAEDDTGSSTHELRGGIQSGQGDVTPGRVGGDSTESIPPTSAAGYAAHGGDAGCANTNTRLQEIIKELKRIREEAKYVAFDIETSYRAEQAQIKSIAFAPDNRLDWAICIPFIFKGSTYWSPEEEVLLWKEIRELLTDERVGKIAHNGSYDIEFIERVSGFRVRPYVFDTMLAAHALYLELPKALAFWVSVMTDHPFYKDMIDTNDATEFFKYNAIDACLTMEIATKFMAQLHKEGRWEFYQDFLHALWEPLMEMQQLGVKFDYLKRNSVKKRYQEEIAVLQKKLDAAVGHPLNVNSPKQMKEWLYKELALKEKTKKRKSTGTTTVAADDEALQELYEESKNEAIQTVIKIREKSKILGTYLDVTLDEDKRIRCSYLITGTETGRLSSRTTARGTGTNLQNVPPGVIKTLFVPDDGKVFINADLSQAEARVVAFLADERSLIKIFDDGGDIHKRNAANIFKVPEAEVTDHQRQLAKRVVHASNYGMGPITFAKTASIPAADAKRLLNQYFATYPGIARWQENIKAEVRKKRYLVTPLGRKRIFYNQWQESLFKEALAYVPQSTVADIVAKGLIRLWNARTSVPGLDILLQVHDSILIQAPVDASDKAAALLKESLTVPVEIMGKILKIPIDLKIGGNWEDMSKYVDARKTT